MSTSYKGAAADLRKAAADLDSVRAAKSAASRFDFANADGNREAIDTAKREGWRRTPGPSHAKRSR